MRANDGAVDRQGRFWCGAMNDPSFTNGKFDPVGKTGVFISSLQHIFLILVLQESYSVSIQMEVCTVCWKT